MAGGRGAARCVRGPRARARAAARDLSGVRLLDGGSIPRSRRGPARVRRERPRPRGRRPLGAGTPPAPIPFVPCATRLPADSRDELGEEEIVRLFAARGEELHRILAAADRLRREVNGDTVTYVVTRNINYTNVCYFRCGFCAFSKGKLAANLRGAPYLVPLDEIVRRSREAWERGAVEVCLQGGIHPAFDGDYYLSIVPRDQGQRSRTSTSMRSRRSRSGRARRRSGSASRSTSAPARRGARLTAGDRGRDPRRRGPPRHLSRQGHDRAVAPRPRHGAPRRPAIDDDDHVRPCRRPAELGSTPDRAPRAAAADRRLHRVRAAALRPHGGADLPQGQGPPRPDLPRGAADARGRPARAPSRGSRTSRPRG